MPRSPNDPRKDWTAEQWREATEGARRRARFKFARDRIEKIANQLPAFTDEELADLVVLLRRDPGRAAGREKPGRKGRASRRTAHQPDTPTPTVAEGDAPGAVAS